MRIEDMPGKFTFPLVDEVARAAKLSPGKARKLIKRGKVTVNGVTTYDLDARVSDKDVVRVFV